MTLWWYSFPGPSAGQALEKVPGDASQRINWLYLPHSGAHQQIKSPGWPTTFYLQVQRVRSPGKRYRASWADFAHVLVNTKEFIYLR